MKNLIPRFKCREYDFPDFSAPSTGFVEGKEKNCPCPTRVFASTAGDDVVFTLNVPEVIDPRKQENMILFASVLTLFLSYYGHSKCMSCRAELRTKKEKYGMPVQRVVLYTTPTGCRALVVISCNRPHCLSFSWFARLQLRNWVFPSLRVRCHGCRRENAEILCPTCMTETYCSLKCMRGTSIHRTECEKMYEHDGFAAAICRFKFPVSVAQRAEIEESVFV